MIIGYARCSTQEQNFNRQIDALEKYGCERIYKDTISGIKKERPALELMFNSLRRGDVVVISELTRLGRSTKDLFIIVEKIHALGADVKSLKETWLDTTSTIGRFLFTIIAGLAQFERDLIVDRTKEGLASARARGRLGGRPKVNPKVIEQAIVMYNSRNIEIADILQSTGISRTTLYKYLKDKNK